ncbi:hypothetical protein Glove_352g22 [Diversispora epigaea]|uniref:TLDc domain-containing protein n=1 Tax=Diversispora epigaea TaxID=1348612 RepID=A0A397HH37_9GLOM|nr:hypothetical protein Glove_352g22 [Diversispora epigaea]
MPTSNSIFSYSWYRCCEQSKPYKKILDKQLCEDLKQHFMALEHVAEISSWIDYKSSTYSLTNTPYEFQLRGSINGFNPQTFLDTCHGHASIVVIIKVKGTEEILGGYNPLAWDSNAANTGDGGSWEKTDDGFIISY